MLYLSILRFINYVQIKNTREFRISLIEAHCLLYYKKQNNKNTNDCLKLKNAMFFIDPRAGIYTRTIFLMFFLPALRITGPAAKTSALIFISKLAMR